MAEMREIIQRFAYNTVMRGKLQFLTIFTALFCMGASPASMKWIPTGEFSMGTDDPHSMDNERPAVRVLVDGFWMDEHDVTNAEFRRFVEATGYVTTADRPIDWDEMKKQLPPGTPKPDPSLLEPGALVFTPVDHPVDLTDLAAWWRWVPGADW